MTYPPVPKDSGQAPISSLYIPGSGWVALQGAMSSTDGLGNASAGVVAALYGKVTTPGDTPLLLDSSGHVLIGNTVQTFITNGNPNGQATMVNSAPVVIASDQGPVQTQGPTTTAVQAANTAGNLVVKATAGALWSAVVITLGTAALTIYDNASTNSGTPLLVIPASAAVGTIYNFSGGEPAANGIVSAGVANCPAVTFSYR